MCFMGVGGVPNRLQKLNERTEQILKEIRALQEIKAIADVYFNDSKFVAISKIATEALNEMSGS